MTPMSLAVLNCMSGLTWVRSMDAGVAGGTASGKTTVCDMIIQQLHDHRVVLVNQVLLFLYKPYCEFSS
jgi:Flp pilus assembly CpaF family ATPase